MLPRPVNCVRVGCALALVLLVGCQTATDALPASVPVASASTVVDGSLPDDVSLEDSTRAVFRAVIDRAAAEDWQALPMGPLVTTVGTALVGTPYVDGLLDVDDEETLVLNLRAVDCVLYVENVLALAEGIALGDTTFAGFAARVEALRYRGGQRDGYASRLHYFSDWLRDNAARNHVRLVTDDVPGAEAYPKTVGFMTAYRESYAKLAPDAPHADSLLATIAETEARLNAAPGLTYLPQDRIADAYDALQAGDLLATTTSIDGLDVTHTGFVLKTDGGGTGFLHASSTGAVKLAPDLAAYVEGNRVQTGLLVARPVDPRSASGRTDS
ncbi:MAG: N-acetylmuramoyl-L-alanine amidase-like domain-containing protein [Bacteroidota bacterium]